MIKSANAGTMGVSGALVLSTGDGGWFVGVHCMLVRVRELVVPVDLLQSALEMEVLLLEVTLRSALATVDLTGGHISIASGEGSGSTSGFGCRYSSTGASVSGVVRVASGSTTSGNSGAVEMRFAYHH